MRICCHRDVLNSNISSSKMTLHDLKTTMFVELTIWKKTIKKKWAIYKEKVIIHLTWKPVLYSSQAWLVGMESVRSNGQLKCFFRFVSSAMSFLNHHSLPGCMIQTHFHSWTGKIDSRRTCYGLSAFWTCK